MIRPSVGSPYRDRAGGRIKMDQKRLSRGNVDLVAILAIRADCAADDDLRRTGRECKGMAPEIGGEVCPNAAIAEPSVSTKAATFSAGQTRMCEVGQRTGTPTIWNVNASVRR